MIHTIAMVSISVYMVVGFLELVTKVVDVLEEGKKTEK